MNAETPIDQAHASPAIAIGERALSSTERTRGARLAQKPPIDSRDVSNPEFLPTEAPLLMPAQNFDERVASNRIKEGAVSWAWQS